MRNEGAIGLAWGWTVRRTVLRMSEAKGSFVGAGEAFAGLPYFLGAIERALAAPLKQRVVCVMWHFSRSESVTQVSVFVTLALVALVKILNK